MHIEIRAERIPFVQEMITRGHYRDDGEMLIAGLRLLQSREELVRDVDAGIEHLEAGQTLHSDEVFGRLERRARVMAGENCWYSHHTLPGPSK